MTRSRRAKHETSHERAVRSSLSIAIIPLQLMAAMLRRPGRTLVTLLLGVSSFAIIANALSDNQGLHPAPMFNTRGALPAVQPQAPVGPAKDVARVTAENSPSAASGGQPPAETVAGVETPDLGLVAQIQRQLSALGFYSGAIDGLSGPQTEAAIRDYESSRGLPLSGQPTDALAASLANAAGTTQVASRSSDPLSDVIEASQSDAVASTVPAPRPTPDPAIRRVQQALQSSGYGPLDIDGLMGRQTEAAIKRFEADKGLPVTGEISDRLEAQLILSGSASR